MSSSSAVGLTATPNVPPLASQIHGQKKAVSDLTCAENCHCSAVAFGIAFAYAAVAIVLLILSAACPAAAPILIMMGLMFFGLEVVYGIMANGFLLRNCHFLLERGACQKLIETIDGKTSNGEVPYIRLGEWLRNPFANADDFLRDRPAVVAFRELINEGNENAKKIFAHFADDEQGYIKNCDNLNYDELEYVGNQNTSSMNL